jgi:hypothetical protein
MPHLVVPDVVHLAGKSQLSERLGAPLRENRRALRCRWRGPPRPATVDLAALDGPAEEVAVVGSADAEADGSLAGPNVASAPRCRAPWWRALVMTARLVGRALALGRTYGSRSRSHRVEPRREPRTAPASSARDERLPFRPPDRARHRPGCPRDSRSASAPPRPCLRAGAQGTAGTVESAVVRPLDRGRQGPAGVAGGGVARGPGCIRCRPEVGRARASSAFGMRANPRVDHCRRMLSATATWPRRGRPRARVARRSSTAEGICWSARRREGGRSPEAAAPPAGHRPSRCARPRGPDSDPTVPRGRTGPPSRSCRRG